MICVMPTTGPACNARASAGCIGIINSFVVPFRAEWQVYAMMALEGFLLYFTDYACNAITASLMYDFSTTGQASMATAGPLAVSGTKAVSPQQAVGDACAPVQAASQKTTSASNSSKATNAGGLNVGEAYEKITSEDGHRETCKYLRDETVSGEDANVYSDVFSSKSGMSTGTVWVSKKNGWVLKREVDVQLAGVGKGHQSIVFEYPKQ